MGSEEKNFLTANGREFTRMGRGVWWRRSATFEVNEMMVVGERASRFSWASTLIERRYMEVLGLFMRVAGRGTRRGIL